MFCPLQSLPNLNLFSASILGILAPSSIPQLSRVRSTRPDPRSPPKALRSLPGREKLRSRTVMTLEVTEVRRERAERAEQRALREQGCEPRETG